MIGEFVIVRTFSAGVHCGILAEFTGTCVVLHDARRIWRWRGANSIHELSLNGAAEEWTRISDPAPTVCLTQAIEVIPCSTKSQKNLTESRWGN